MVRKLALAVSLALGTLSVPAHALGLGELDSKSGLNQNFNGDITLLSIKPEELDSVRVKLADAKAFAAAGVERPYYLSQLRFTPAVTRRGKPVIRVTSEFPVREPFLNFLVEVNWPNGRLVREYTVLLDPPTVTKRRAPVVAPAATTRRSAPEVRRPPAKPAPAVVAADSGEYRVRANDTAWHIAKRYRPGGVSMAQMMMALLNANPEAFVNNDINRLRKGKILRIPPLDEIRQLSRREAQVAYAEQQEKWLARRSGKLQAQPAASPKVAEQPPAEGQPKTAERVPVLAESDASDVNDQLRIATARPQGEGEAGAGDDDASTPVASDLKSRLIVARENAETSRQQAESLRSQVDDLQARLADMQKLLSLKDDQLASLQDRVVAEEAAKAIETELAAAQERVLANTAESDAAEQTGAAVDAAISEITDDGAAAENEIVVVEEAAESAKALATPAPVRAAFDRIQDIAPQIDPDRIVMEASAGDSVMPAVSPETPVDEQPEVTDIAPQIDPERTAEAAGSDEVMAGDTLDGAELVIEDAINAAAEDAVIAENTIVAPVVQAPPVQALTEPSAAEQSESAASAAQPWLAMLEKNMVPVAAGGVAVLGLFGWLLTRRRRDTDEGEPLVAGAAAAAGEAAPVAADAVAAVDEPALTDQTFDDLPDSSFLDEFTPNDINALQDETGEVDPVSEADVYIAYGRYQQAEELLGQAMAREPDRLALKHKLLEVHYATRNVEAFTELAQQMVDAGQDTVNEDAWTRAQDMGRELAPDNQMFALREGEVSAGVAAVAAGAVASAATAAVGASNRVDSDTLSLDDLELSELSSEYEIDSHSTGDLEAPSEVSIQLDLEDSSEVPEPSTPDLPESISLESVAPLDFELPEADVDAAGIGLVNDDDEITDSLDLDSMMAEADAAVTVGDSTLSLDSDFSAEELQAQLDELSDLSVLDTETEEVEQVAAAEPPDALGLVEEDVAVVEEGLDQPVDLEAALDAADEVEGAVEDSGMVADDGPDGDEVATKLDLARAYVEMGDEDGARGILEEVLVEGNQAQRGDAQQLLAEIG